MLCHFCRASLFGRFVQIPNPYPSPSPAMLLERLKAPLILCVECVEPFRRWFREHYV